LLIWEREIESGIYGDGTNVLIALEALNQLFTEFIHVLVATTHTQMAVREDKVRATHNRIENRYECALYHGVASGKETLLRVVRHSSPSLCVVAGWLPLRRAMCVVWSDGEGEGGRMSEWSRTEREREKAKLYAHDNRDTEA
jgi:hypothetical protein